MTGKRQIPISFPVQESYDVHDFMPLECNAQARAWIDRFPDWPYPVLIIYGEQGCGKTHLLKLWQSRLEEDALHIAIDDVDKHVFGNRQAEEDLFHKINLAKQNLTYILLAMSNNIGFYELELPDLQSRLRAAPQVEIEAPDDVAMQAILVKLFQDRQLKVEPGVIAYILPRVERSFRALQSLVQTLDENALSEKRAITVPLVRDVLAEPELFG